MNIRRDLLWDDLIPLMRGPKETWEKKQIEDTAVPSYGWGEGFYCRYEGENS